MLLEIADEQAPDVKRGSRALVDCMSPARIFHEVEWFPEFDQAIYQQFSPLKMNIIIASAMHQ